MKKFSFTLLSVLLLCCFVFVGCSNTASLLYKTNENNSIVNYKTQTAINLPEETDIDEATDRGNLIVTKTVEGKNYVGVFNLIENKMVVDYVENQDSLTFTLISTEQADYIKVVDSEMVNVYDLAKSLDLNNYIVSGKNLTYYSIVEDGAVYETWKTDTRTEVFTYNKKGVRKVVDVLDANFGLNWEKVVPAAALFGKAGEGKFIETEELKNDNLLVSIYKKGKNSVGKLTKSYTLDLHNVSAVLSTIDFEDFANVLGSQGRYAIIQKTITKDIMEDNYDVLEGGALKLDIETYRLDILTGKMKKIKCDYIFDGATTYSNEDGLVMISGLSKIVDKMAQDQVGAVVNLKTGKVTELTHFYNNVVELAKNRYMADEKHIIDSKFNIVADLSEYTILGYAENRIVLANDNKYTVIDFDGKIYNRNVEFEMTDFVAVANDRLILKNHVDSYKDINGTEYEIDGYVAVSLNDGYDINFESRKNGSVVRYFINGVEKTDVLTLHNEDGLIYTISTSETAGNSVYTFYTADGTQVGRHDVKTGFVNVVTYGENNAHAYLTIGDNYFTCY